MERIPEVTERERKVLVEEILKKLAHAQVRPASVDKQKSFQVAELGHREVASKHGLHAFLTADTNADVRRYIHTNKTKKHYNNHSHIILISYNCYCNSFLFLTPGNKYL